MTDAATDVRTEKLRADLDSVAASLADFESALFGVNDEPLVSAFRAPIDIGQKVIAHHREQITLTIADDMANLFSQFRRHPVPREDPDLGKLDSLTRLRSARGSLFADLETVLEQAGNLGLRPSDPPVEAPAAIEFERAGLGRLLSGLERRLGEVESALKAVQSEGRPDDGRTHQQIGLVNFYVDNMSIELALARLETLAKDLVDFASLARAVESMGELTRDFLATIDGMRQKITMSLRAAAQGIRPAVRRVASGMRAIIHRVRKRPTRLGPDALSAGPDQHQGAQPVELQGSVREGSDHDRFWELIREGGRSAISGNLAEARGAYNAAHDLALTNSSKSPGDFLWQRNLSVGFTKLGDIEMAAGNLGAARERFEAALAIDERLARHEPENSEWQRDLSVSMERLGNVEVAAGNLGAARERYEAALAIAERLARHEPENSEWQRDLSVSFNKLGDVEVAAGNLGAARERYEAGIVISERLARQEPANSEWQRDLSVSMERLGNVEEVAGNVGVARERYEAALAIRERLARMEPANSEWQRDLFVSHSKLAQLDQAEGEPEEALRHLGEAERIVAGLAALRQDHPGFARDLAQVRRDIERLSGPSPEPKSNGE